MNPVVRQLVPTDRPQVEAIVHSNPKMYGADITKHHPYIIARFINQQAGELERTSWGVDVDGELVGLAIQYWWTIMPVWSIAALFFKNEPGKNQFNAVKIGAVLVNRMCEFAEQRGVKDFMYVVRDHGDLRKQMSLDVNNELKSRYDIIDLQVLKPGEVPKHVTLKNMVNIVQGKHTKPIVFRMAHLKNELRNVW